mgnify:CR=1 FL=1
MRSSHILGAVLGLSLLWLAPAAQADIAVIVHAANPVQQLTSRQVAELYLGRSRTFASGQYAQVVDQGIYDPLRGRFFKEFTGQVQPPQNLDGDSAVLEFVRRNPGAIGYVSATTLADARVKTVLVLRE